MTPARTRDPELLDHPPSDKCVLAVLEREGPLLRQELLEVTRLNPRTLDRALERLQNDGFIDRARDTDDLRQTTVSLSRE